jgi:uncharacterized heparinase superfamily protein
MAWNYDPQLWGFVASEAWRRARRRLRSGPLYRWRFSGPTPERILIAPPDLRLADGPTAQEFYRGRFPLAGCVVETGGTSPFRVERAPAAWQESLHGFRWLRHMRAAETTLAAGNARALVSEWISIHGRKIAAPAWAPPVVARRLIAWLQHSPIVLAGADMPTYKAFLKSLAVQLRYLRAVAGEMPDGEERLRARIAIVFATLSLPSSPARLHAVSRALALELDRQILPDGIHISRNPGAGLELLADLLPLRQTYFNQGEAPPDALIGAIERMMPALRFFRHRDGVLARFNGMGATSHDRVAAILHHDDTGGSPILHASHGGYDRLVMGDTTVIADTGAPPPPHVSHEAQAGCLSFEMSSGRHHFIVNCGVDSYGAEDFRLLSRSTAAHSTATVNDNSSARFTLPGRLRAMVGSPLIGPIRKVRCKRFDSSGIQGVTASHDGYLSRFGIFHERELMLAGNGDILEGTDRFYSNRDGMARPGPGLTAQIRFHLHPDIGVFRNEHGQLVLKGNDTDIWTVEVEGVSPVVEESMFFAAISGPRRSRQLLVEVDPSVLPEVAWRFTRVEKAGS